jgi:hypothetical protein
MSTGFLFHDIDGGVNLLITWSKLELAYELVNFSI